MDIVTSFHAIAEALAFTPTEYDQFNQDIQVEIERQPLDIATQLANIKFEANRRYYWQVRPDRQTS